MNQLSTRRLFPPRTANLSGSTSRTMAAATPLYSREELHERVCAAFRAKEAATSPLDYLEAKEILDNCTRELVEAIGQLNVGRK